MEEKHQKKVNTNKDTEIAKEFINASLNTFEETKRRLSVETEHDFTSPKQKKRILLDNSRACERKINNN